MNRRLATFLITASVATCLTTVPSDRTAIAQAKPEPAVLAVSGATNATPSLAVGAGLLAVVWTAQKSGVVDVYAAVSRDGGATFSVPSRVNDQPGDASANAEQPPRIVIAGSPDARTLTVLWSKRGGVSQASRRDVVRFARSRDDGRTFSPARSIPGASVAGARGWQSATAAADGAVHVVWLDGREAEKKIADMAHAGIPHKAQPPQDIYHARLAGDAVAETRIASDVCFCCKTALAVDARGGVYAAWRHIFPGSMRDIAFAKSSDTGRRFGPVVRVSEDNWQLNGCPEDGPSMAVADNGTIHLAWATLVGDEEPHKALFYSTSHDGATFTPRAPIPATGTNPGRPQLVVNQAGGVVVVWEDVVGGTPRVFATTMPAAKAVAVEMLSGHEAASRPVISRTSSTEVVVAWTSRPAGTDPASSTIRIARVRR